MSAMMKGFILLAAAGIWVSGSIQGQNPNSPPPFTLIAVEKMHCENCAKRIAGKLYEVNGVEKILVDVPKKLLWVYPKTGVQPSPKGLWEAVEKGNDRPTKLHGPYGSFTVKPQL